MYLVVINSIQKNKKHWANKTDPTKMAVWSGIGVF